MTPHDLIETCKKFRGVERADAALGILLSAQHFDAGYVDEMPMGQTWASGVRPPFQTTTVVTRDKKGNQVLYGCWEDSDDDFRWHCFSAMKVNGGIGLQFFSFCPSTFAITVPAKFGVGDEESVQHGATVLNQFFAVIACSNVRMVDVPAPAALNKKRIRNGKPPIQSHKVLHLVAPTTYSKSDHKGGTHSSPRVHLRRGHIRRLPSGVTVWVQQCVVGSKHGIVTKDYAVSYAAASA